ncbi:MAG: hypothetical protein IJY12_05660 [Clostridia bacterium]|nr:hypothetical protein [Clostridia bacterium]
MESRKYCKNGDGEHITSTETLDPSVPNRAHTEMKKDTKEGDPSAPKSEEDIVPPIEG